MKERRFCVRGKKFNQDLGNTVRTAVKIKEGRKRKLIRIEHDKFERETQKLDRGRFEREKAKFRKSCFIRKNQYFWCNRKHGQHERLLYIANSFDYYGRDETVSYRRSDRFQEKWKFFKHKKNGVESESPTSP